MGLPESQSITPKKIDLRQISKINKVKILHDVLINIFSCRESKVEFQTKITITSRVLIFLKELFLSFRVKKSYIRSIDQKLFNFEFRAKNRAPPVISQKPSFWNFEGL